ncbi:hypothetical protein HI914_07086 [Erysiphe necator]|nr:hypothetical protein HI914_07086 [Erysiphe necator]
MIGPSPSPFIIRFLVIFRAANPLKFISLRNLGEKSSQDSFTTYHPKSTQVPLYRLQEHNLQALRVQTHVLHSHLIETPNFCVASDNWPGLLACLQDSNT